MKINNYSPDEHQYLQMLADIAHPVKRLYGIGSLPEKRLPTVAIVGSRKPTAYGREVTERFATELAMRGAIIISGLALGVDSLAHKAALDARGITIAVLANGLPNIYPSSHKDLAKRIIKSGGAILSEYEPESSARGYQFLERNRIVSGLADAVVITEAASRSGTLNTAMHALEQGKELFAAPGNITSPMSAGCNLLLEKGARPALSTEEIIETIMPGVNNAQISLSFESSSEESIIIELIRSGIRDGEELQQKSKLNVSLFSSTLTMLEINGVVKPLGANKWTLR